MDRAALALLFMFVLFDVLGGAVRYYSVHLGLPLLPYLPSMLLLLALAPMYFSYVISEGVAPTNLAVLFLFGAAAMVGALNLGNASQVEFGFWTMVPFLYGIVVLPSLIRAWKRIVPYVVFLWVLAVAGVLTNFFYAWPWIGFGYQIGGVSIQASRFWNTGGWNFLRLPGFSQASYFVAPQVLLLGVFLMETLRGWWRIPLWVLSGLAVLLTTSKTGIFTFFLVSAVWVLGRGTIRSVFRMIPVVAGSLDIALPFSMLLITGNWLDLIHSKLGVTLIASFVERMQVGWPVWIRMAVLHGNVIFGRGLGGIGPAQAHFEPMLFSPSDNIAVFVYATFGLLGLALLLFYGWKASRSRIDGPIGRFFFFSACVVMLEGAALSVMDATMLGLAFGVSLRYFLEQGAVVPSGVPVRGRQAARPIQAGDSQPECT